MLLGQILGSIGLVLTLSTPLTFLITGEFGVPIFIKLGLGLALLSYYFVSNRGSTKSLLGGRGATMWSLSGATIVVFTIAVVAVNFVASKNPKEWDLTREGIYTLADQTTKTLEKLKDEITVYAFYRTDEPLYRAAKDTLERYQSFSPKLKIVFVDPMKSPDLAEKYQIRENGGRLIFSAKGNHEARPKDLSEQELTNALVKVTADAQKKIYFLTGHGEADMADTTEKGTSEAVAALKNEGYAVESLSLNVAPDGSALTLDAPASGEPTVPADAQAIIVLSPKVPLSPVESEALSKWAQKGGKLFIGLEARRDVGLEKLAAAWHIEARNDLVVDRNARLLNLPPTVALVVQFDEHPISKDFRSPIALPTTRSLEIKDSGGIAGVTAKSLARTAKTAWGETDLNSNEVAYNEGKDSPPPLIVAAVATKKVSEAGEVADEGRVIVIGDSEFTINRYFHFQGNADFFVNSLNYLAEEEGKISIRPKQRGASRIFLTEAESSLIKFFSLDFLPVAILAIGITVRGVRRRR